MCLIISLDLERSWSPLPSHAHAVLPPASGHTSRLPSLGLPENATVVRVASRVPQARMGGAVEVRPFITYW